MFLATMIWGALSVAPTAANGVEGLEVVGTQFHVTLPDGTILASQELVGAVLTLADGARLRIDGVEPDPRDGDVLLHKLSLENADGTWSDACEPDPDGLSFGFPIAGHLLPDGNLATRPGSFQIICTSGAQGKCVRFGYKPWLEGRDGRPMLDYFNACVRMMRADYCGNGTSTTEDGTLILPYDRIGVRDEETIAGMAFEAGWSANGATCIARVRIPENTSLDELNANCPRLRQVPTGSACTQAIAATQSGTLLFNSSFP